jgi:hypothetical protein
MHAYYGITDVSSEDDKTAPLKATVHRGIHTSVLLKICSRGFLCRLSVSFVIPTFGSNYYYDNPMMRLSVKIDPLVYSCAEAWL